MSDTDKIFMIITLNIGFYENTKPTGILHIA